MLSIYHGSSPTLNPIIKAVNNLFNYKTLLLWLFSTASSTVLKYCWNHQQWYHNFCKEKTQSLQILSRELQDFMKPVRNVTFQNSQRMNIKFNHRLLKYKTWTLNHPALSKTFLSMVYIVLNGLLVEAETVTEVHLKAEIKRYHRVYPRKKHRSLKEDDTITEIVREIMKQMKGE